MGGTCRAADYLENPMEIEPPPKRGRFLSQYASWGDAILPEECVCLLELCRNRGLPGGPSKRRQRKSPSVSCDDAEVDRPSLSTQATSKRRQTNFTGDGRRGRPGSTGDLLEAHAESRSKHGAGGCSKRRGAARLRCRSAAFGRAQDKGSTGKPKGIKRCGKADAASESECTRDREERRIAIPRRGRNRQKFGDKRGGGGVTQGGVFGVLLRVRGSTPTWSRLCPHSSSVPGHRTRWPPPAALEAQPASAIGQADLAILLLPLLILPSRPRPLAHSVHSTRSHVIHFGCTLILFSDSDVDARST